MITHLKIMTYLPVSTLYVKLKLLRAPLQRFLGRVLHLSKHSWQVSPSWTNNRRAPGLV